MKILNQEHSENVKHYAESIGDTSLQKCLERLKSWEENPDYPSEISLYYDHAPYSFGFTQRYPDGRTGIVGGLLYHGIPDRSFAAKEEKTSSDASASSADSKANNETSSAASSGTTTSE